MAANMTAAYEDLAAFPASGSKRPTARVSPLVVVLGAILLILILPPTVFLVGASFFTTAPDGSFGEFTLRYYQQLLTGRFFLTSLWNSILYAIGSAAVALVLGTAQALIVERTNTPGRRWVFLGAVISLGVPNVLYVVAWLLILGKSGPVNGFMTWLHAGWEAFLNVYSIWGMILIEGLNFVPLTFLLMSAVLRSTDASFEEAAMMSGARPLTAFRTVTLRMGLPGILALLLLVFIRAFESFEVPALVGLAGDINVLTTEIYQRSRSSGTLNYGESGAYSVVLLVIVAGLLLWYNQLSRNAHQYQTITGKGYRPRIIDLGRARYLAAPVLLLLFMLITGLPLGMLVFASLQPFYEGITVESLQRFTLENYTVLLEFGMFRNAIVNTLVLGAATATLVVPLTALCAWLAARRQPGAWILDQIATAPLVFPAIVMSVAFLYIFVSLPIPLYGTLTSIIIASAVRYLPYGMRYAYAGVLQIHTDLEDASMTSGARQGSTFIRIVLPLLSAALASAWLFVFLLAAQAVSLPLLLVGPGTEIVAVTLFDLWQNGQVTELASMGVLWVALMTAVSALFYAVARRHQIAV
jgi:iron(III) transport system permease protein